jgi:hypothetical protein
MRRTHGFVVKLSASSAGGGMPLRNPAIDFQETGGVLMKFQVSAVAVLAVVVVSLGGCLVEKDKGAAKTYASNTNILHTYVAGNVITYDLKEYSGTTRYGTLEVKWEQTADIKDPFSNTYFPVLKETTTVYFNDSASPESQVVRYIEQSTDVLAGTNGTIYLRAIDDPTTSPPNATDDWWLSNQGTVPSVTLDRFVIFRSPITLADTLEINFNVLDDCSGSTCPQSLGTFSNGLTVGNNLVSVGGTRYGTFSNVYRISYAGSLNPTDQPLVSPFDFLDICRTGDLQGIPVNHSGTLDIVPEIGVIRIVNTCSYQSITSEPVQYEAIIRNTNIPLPPLTN